MTTNYVKSVQVGNDVYLLNGEQFYQLKFNGTQRYLVKLAKLETNTSNVLLMFDVVLSDHDNFIVILGKFDHFEVFEISATLTNDAKPIQRITTSGGFQGSKALKLRNDEVIFITAAYMSSAESLLR